MPESRPHSGAAGTPGQQRGEVVRLAITGCEVWVETATRGAGRSAAVIARRLPRLVDLGRVAGTASPEAGRAWFALRDEMLTTWRELAWVSWEESRRAIDELETRTRPDAPPTDPTAWLRRTRVKP